MNETVEISTFDSPIMKFAPIFFALSDNLYRLSEVHRRGSDIEGLLNFVAR